MIMEVYDWDYAFPMNAILKYNHLRLPVVVARKLQSPK